jgi:hypothetical protein
MSFISSIIHSSIQTKTYPIQLTILIIFISFEYFNFTFIWFWIWSIWLQIRSNSVWFCKLVKLTLQFNHTNYLSTVFNFIDKNINFTNYAKSCIFSYTVKLTNLSNWLQCLTISILRIQHITLSNWLTSDIHMLQPAC